MKVKYLIGLLSSQNPEADVVLGDFDVGDDALFVISRKNDNKKVCIQGKSDVDLDYQIQSRYLTAKTDGEATASLYDDLYNHGITVEEICSAMGNDEADIYKRCRYPDEESKGE